MSKIKAIQFTDLWEIYNNCIKFVLQYLNT
jgi:hypothetical protein